MIWPVPAGIAGCMTGSVVCLSSRGCSFLTKFLSLAVLCMCFVGWCRHVHAHNAVHELLLKKLEMNVLCAALYNNSLLVPEKRVSLDAPKILLAC